MQQHAYAQICFRTSVEIHTQTSAHLIIFCMQFLDTGRRNFVLHAARHRSSDMQATALETCDARVAWHFALTRLCSAFPWRLCGLLLPSTFSGPSLAWPSYLSRRRHYSLQESCNYRTAFPATPAAAFDFRDSGHTRRQNKKKRGV